MRFHQKLFAGGLAVAGFLSAHGNSEAQDFGLTVGAAPDPVLVGSPLAYSINITNTFGFQLVNVYVTNSFSTEVTFTGSTSILTDSILTNANEVIFRIGLFPAGFVESLVVNVVPVGAGSLTNELTVLALGRPSLTTNIVVQVTPPPVDLAISLTNVATGLFAGDTTTLGLTITNRGPGDAGGVMVTNTLPVSFDLLSVSPADLNYTFTNGNLAVNVGPLASGSSTQLLVFIRPTNGGVFNIAASVLDATSVDSNPTNNAVTNRMTVDSIVTADLQAVVLLPQLFNPQTGLMEEVVRVTNVGTNDAPSVRLIVSGLLTNWLYNAVGTNNGDPYVLYGATLSHTAPTNYVDLRLEYFVWQRTALTNLTRRAVAVTFTSGPTPPTSSPNITKVVPVAGGLLIEFQSMPGRSYTILYADNMSFSNALAAQPAVTAIADRAQWIDSGPPKTIISTTNASSRFYRVLLNP